MFLKHRYLQIVLRSVVDIKFLLFINTALSIYFYLSFQNDATAMGWITSNLALSGNGLMKFKFWTLISYSLFHVNIHSFLIFLIPIVLTLKKLKLFYSNYELGKFYLFASLTGALTHILLTNKTDTISGAQGISLGFLILFARLYGLKPVFSLFKIKFSYNTIIFILIITDLFLVATKHIITETSFTNHLAILAFCYFYIKKDNKNTNNSYNRKPSSQKIINFSKAYTKASKNNISYKQNTETTTPVNSLNEQANIILDKISLKGIDSLSKKELEALNKISKLKNQENNDNKKND